MATKRFCDACGREVGKVTRGNSVVDIAWGTLRWGLGNDSLIKSWELCSECKKAVETCIKQRGDTAA